MIAGRDSVLQFRAVMIPALLSWVCRHGGAILLWFDGVVVIIPVLHLDIISMYTGGRRFDPGSNHFLSFLVRIQHLPFHLYRGHRIYNSSIKEQ